jgi:hypothetical protein
MTLTDVRKTRLFSVCALGSSSSKTSAEIPFHFADTLSVRSHSTEPERHPLSVAGSYSSTEADEVSMG